MAQFKLTVSDTKGKSVSKELKDSDANPLLGLEIGKETDASIIGFTGKMKITGGSDKSGVPMRSDVHGGARKYVLLSRGVGLPKIETGQRKRKLVRGNSVSEEIYQINCKLDSELPVDTAKPEKDEAPPKEKPAEKKSEAPPKEKPAEKKSEAPPKEKPAEKKSEAPPKEKPAEKKA